MRFSRATASSEECQVHEMVGVVEEASEAYSALRIPQSIRSLFALPGFVVGAGLKGLFGDRYARVIQLKRRKKQLCALTVGNGAGGAMTSKCAGSATCRWQAGGSIWNTSVGASTVLGAAVCM